MTIQEAHYDFKMKMDKVDSLSKPDLNDAEIDWLLNEAQLLFLAQRVGTNNLYKMGFEVNAKRIEDISTLVIKYPLQPAIIPNNLGDFIYEVNLHTLEYNVYQVIAAWAKAQVQDCPDIDVALKHIQHDDYRDSLKDPFNKPSSQFFPYNYGRATTNPDHRSIFIYGSDKPITEVYLEYIKVPRRVSLGTYEYIDGVIYPPQTFEFPESRHTQIVDIAVFLASTIVENGDFANLKQVKLNKHE
jgi:hypothetical protein